MFSEFLLWLQMSKLKSDITGAFDQFLVVIMRFVLRHPNLKRKVMPLLNRFPKVKQKLKQVAIAHGLIIERQRLLLAEESPVPMNLVLEWKFSKRAAYIYAHIVKRQRKF